MLVRKVYSCSFSISTVAVAVAEAKAIAMDHFSQMIRCEWTASGLRVDLSLRLGEVWYMHVIKRQPMESLSACDTPGKD